MDLSACSCFFSCLAILGSLRIRFTCWLIDAGWPIARRSVIHSLLTEVRRFTNAAHTTPATLPDHQQTLRRHTHRRYPRLRLLATTDPHPAALIFQNRQKPCMRAIGSSPISPPFGPTQWLFQRPPAESKFLVVSPEERRSVFQGMI